MDQFGIGQGMKGITNVYYQSARQTGRTTALVESVKNGDRICFLNAKEAERVKRLCRNRGVEVECIVVPPKSPDKLFDRGTSEGRTIFDHSWVEAFYANAIERAAQDISHFERESSGFGMDHRETQQKAREISKWKL